MTSPASQPTGETLAILGAKLIDGTGRDPIEDATLIVEGERILAVGARDAIAVPAHAHVIEAHGKTLLPGLIDCHVHLGFPSGSNLMRRMVTPPSLNLLHAVPNCLATVTAGITTVRDAGGTPAAVKMAVERGFFPGPRMLVAITILSQTGGHADSFLPCCVEMPMTQLPDVPRSVVDGVDEMRKRVREILRAGADWIKLCTSGGVLSLGDAPTSPQFTVDEIAAAVYEASMQNKRCMAHAQATDGIKNALRAGVTSIEHGIWLDDEAIEMMLRQGAYLVPTLIAPLDVIATAEANPNDMPPWAVEKARQVAKEHQASFRKAVAAGVKVAMGTDTGVGPHGHNARELRLMVENGMTPMQAILASTSEAARLLRLDVDLGTLQAGKLADVLLVDGDPLATIAVVEDPTKIDLVLKGGERIKSQVEIRRRASMASVTPRQA